jgi:hypothetical protein
MNGFALLRIFFFSIFAGKQVRKVHEKWTSACVVHDSLTHASAAGSARQSRSRLQVRQTRSRLHVHVHWRNTSIRA